MQQDLQTVAISESGLQNFKLNSMFKYTDTWYGSDGHIVSRAKHKDHVGHDPENH